MILSAATEVPAYPVSENFATVVGLTVLLLTVAIAAALFVFCGFKTAPFDFIDKEPFETEYGVSGMVKERQKAYRGTYVRCNVIAVCLCILSPVPLFMGAFTENAFFTVLMLSATMLLAGIGATLFVFTGVRWASMQKLLKEGDFSPEKMKKSRRKETVGRIYWLTATAVYLLWSFLSNAWDRTWVVWPVAGVLFAAIMCVCNLFTEREK